jgi:HEAT repeat protein
MNTIGHKLAAVAFTLCAFAGSSQAGKGGSAALIEQAVASGSIDAIKAEVERTEMLSCSACIDTMIALTADDRYEVREVAAWWFAKRPVLKNVMVAQMVDDLANGDAIHVRNAADFLGRVREFKALPGLRSAFGRGLTAEARFAIVRAAGFMAHTSGNPILQAAMSDADAGVRAEAVIGWRDVLQQTSAAPVEPLLADSDARVRAEAATVLGAYRDAAARTQLEQLVVHDADPSVRRNAAWALAKIGSVDSRPALLTASQDASPLVRGVAQAALAQLK